MPQLTLYLDVDLVIGFERTAKARGKKDRLESESLTFHKKVRSAYRSIAKKEPKRVHIIDASQSPDAVYDQAMRKIDALLHPRRK